MFDDADLNRRGLVIANLYFKGFVDPSRVEISSVLRARSLAGHVESVAGIQTDGFLFGSVVNIVLPGKFELAIVVAPVETHSPLRKRHAKMIFNAILEL